MFTSSFKVSGSILLINNPQGHLTLTRKHVKQQWRRGCRDLVQVRASWPKTSCITGKKKKKKTGQLLCTLSYEPMGQILSNTKLDKDSLVLRIKIFFSFRILLLFVWGYFLNYFFLLNKLLYFLIGKLLFIRLNLVVGDIIRCSTF